MIPGINEGVVLKNNKIILSRNQNKVRNCKHTFTEIKNVSKKRKNLQNFEVISNKRYIYRLYIVPLSLKNNLIYILFLNRKREV